MVKTSGVLLTGLLALLPAGARGEDLSGTRLLLVAARQDFQALLPQGTTLLHDPITIEKFLEALDDSPPDWGTLHGTHGDRHDERLFALNRERDGLRAGRAALAQRITFL